MEAKSNGTHTKPRVYKRLWSYHVLLELILMSFGMGTCANPQYHLLYINWVRMGSPSEFSLKAAAILTDFQRLNPKKESLLLTFKKSPNYLFQSIQQIFKWNKYFTTGKLATSSGKVTSFSLLNRIVIFQRTTGSMKL